MDFNSPFLKIVSIVADFVTITTLIAAIPFALLRRKSNVFAFKVNKLLHNMGKIAGIVVIALIVFQIWKLCYFIFVLPLTGSVTDQNFYWESGKEAEHLIAYFISGVIALIIMWILSTFIWTSSWDLTKEFFNLFLSKNKLLRKQQFQLEIMSAIYKTAKAEIDVTPIVREMVSNNKLNIRASNELAGDPDPGVAKHLIINYRYENKPLKIRISEGETIEIP